MTERFVSIVRVVGGFNYDDSLNVLYLNNGKTVVVEDGEFVPNEFAVFVNAGSWIPHDWAPWMSQYYTPRVSQEGIIGYHVRSRNIQGHKSDGILLSLKQFPVWKEMIEDEFLSTFNHTEKSKLNKRNIAVKSNPMQLNDVTEWFGELAVNYCNVYPYQQHKNHSIAEYLKISKGTVWK